MGATATAIDPNTRLEAAVHKENLTGFLAAALCQLAHDSDGWDQSAAAYCIASLNNVSINDGNQAIIELLGRNLLVRVDTNGGPRLFANYQKLGIDEATRNSLHTRPQSFTVLGAPHSPRSMATLDSLFRDNPEPIYLALEVTSNTVFRELKQRAVSGRKTVFLVPRKRHLPSDKRLHYDEVIGEWISFLRDGQKQLRDNIQLCFTSRALPHLYTSSLTKETVRLDLYHYGEKTTRAGEMIEAKFGSPLYDLTYRQYCDAVYWAVPLFRFWPWQWFVRRMRHVWILIATIAVAALLMEWGPKDGMAASVVPAIITLVLGVTGNSVYEYLKSRKWEAPRLYEK